MDLRRGRWAVLAMLAALASQAGAETITGARYVNPVERYGHFALGRPHEYSRLAATTDAGRSVAFELSGDEVFEDLEPRLVALAAGEPREVLAIVSRRDSGSRLVLFRLNGNRLEPSAESAAIGTPNRWLNPVGVADLDGDGRAEIAAVVTPHIGGTLKVYRRNGSRLVEAATLAGFSNHAYGTSELGLSAIVPMDGRMRLLVPDTSRMHLRLIALEGGRLVETGGCAMPAQVTGAVRVVSGTEVSVGLASGPRVFSLRDCAPAHAAGWAGRYVYDTAYGKTAGGSHVAEEYSLLILDGAATACVIAISGFQTDEKLLCDLDRQQDKLTLRFRGYESGGTKNSYGVEVYRAGTPLLTLERQAAKRGEKLVTRWEALTGLDGKKKMPGDYFRKIPNTPSEEKR